MILDKRHFSWQRLRVSYDEEWLIHPDCEFPLCLETCLWLLRFREVDLGAAPRLGSSQCSLHAWHVPGLC